MSNARTVVVPRGFLQLAAQLRACRLCEAELPFEPRPIFQLTPCARILIAAQAPGRKAHERATPFDDVSGDRLRAWMGVSRAEFYDASRIAILPMGLCFPGSSANGDLPPRPECANAWRARVLSMLTQLRLTLVIGRYAQAWHMGASPGESVASRVAAWREQAPAVFALPHPSPRNQRWLRNHPWFEAELLPQLRDAVRQALAPANQRGK